MVDPITHFFPPLAGRLPGQHAAGPALDLLCPGRSHGCRIFSLILEARQQLGSDIGTFVRRQPQSLAK